MVTWPKGQTWSREQTFERGGMVEGEAKSKEEIRSKKVTWLRGRQETIKKEDTVSAGMRAVI